MRKLWYCEQCREIGEITSAKGMFTVMHTFAYKGGGRGSKNEPSDVYVPNG